MTHKFRVAARALRQMRLITSDDVALNELIKNAFDARSSRVTVQIAYSQEAFADRCGFARSYMSVSSAEPEILL